MHTDIIWPKEPDLVNKDGSPMKREFTINSIDRVEPTARLLAEFFPNPGHIMTGIYELLINGLEHGNLGIGFATKARLIKEGKWHEEVLRRQKMPQYKDRKLHVTIDRKETGSTLHISDEREGFNSDYYMKNVVPNHLPNGRGLRIVQAIGFDDIKYNERGNEVTCVINRRN